MIKEIRVSEFGFYKGTKFRIMDEKIDVSIIISKTSMEAMVHRIDKILAGIYDDYKGLDSVRFITSQANFNDINKVSLWNTTKSVWDLFKEQGIEIKSEREV